MKSTFQLQSPENETVYHVYIVAPDMTADPGPWPAVLFMDGDDQFSYAVKAYEKLRANHAVQPLLLVGVGYGASYREDANRRGRDYTPTYHSDEPSSGGGHVFLQFLTGTLWPELNRRYPVRGDARGIAGHSLGSLLALYALWQEPLFFTHVLASSPSIWWDNRSVLRIGADRHARSAELSANLFLSVGKNDTESMTGDLDLLEQQLKRAPFHGLRTDVVRFPDRDHYNVIVDAFSAGLATLFPAKNK